MRIKALIVRQPRGYDPDALCLDDSLESIERRFQKGGGADILSSTELVCVNAHRDFTIDGWVEYLPPEGTLPGRGAVAGMVLEARPVLAQHARSAALEYRISYYDRRGADVAVWRSSGSETYPCDRTFVGTVQPGNDDRITALLEMTVQWLDGD